MLLALICLPLGQVQGQVLIDSLISPNEEIGGYFGVSVAGVGGDVNTDGVVDIIVGAWRENPGGSPTNAGRAYILSGADSAVFVPQQSGDYRLRITQNGCTDSSGCFTFVLTEFIVNISMEHPAYILQQRLITVAEYHKMIQAGILGEDERVELLYGKIIPTSPVGSQHSTCVKRLNRLFSRSVGDRAIVSVQDPIQIPDHSEPEPDVALLRPPLSTYEARHPLPKEVLLIVEVSDSSLAKDRAVKLPLYASAGIPEVWLVDLAHSQIQVYT